MSQSYVSIGEHKYILPPVPKDKTKILLHDQNRDNAFWDRERLVKDYKKLWWDYIPYFTKINQGATLYDQDDRLIAINKEDTDYIVRTYEQEMNRRRFGVWFNNGGEPTYLTGDYYFVLAWCKTKRPDKKGDWFDYREYQSRYCYLIDHVNKSDKILGLFLSKAKKTGITNLHWLYYLNKSTMTKNVNIGAMNIQQEMAAKTFRDHFMYSYNGLPPALKPEWKRKVEVDGLITFGKRYTNTRKGAKDETEDELNTTVMCVPTKDHAFDVDVFTDIYYDEPPKFTQDFGRIFRTNSAGTMIQDTIVGKIWLTSYTPSPDESTDSFISARDLFLDSELKTITAKSNGQTKSKLIAYHLPAFESWATEINKYGKCNEKAAISRIEEGRSILKDKPKELQGLIRMYANNKKESWLSGGRGSIFDPNRMTDLISAVIEEERESTSNLYVDGCLLWQNVLWEVGLKNKRPKGQFCPVRFVPLTQDEKERGMTGRLRIYNPIPPQLQNRALMYGKDEDGNLIPPPFFTYVTGADPTAQASASEVIQGSKNAFYTMSMPDERTDSLYKGIASNVIHLEYYHRPEMPNEAYEDAVKQIIWTGSLCSIEANVPDLANGLMQEGLGNFMLVRDKSGVITTWKRWMGLYNEEKKQYQLLRTTPNKELLEMFVRLAKTYLYKPEEGAKDYGATIKSARLLEQVRDLDVTDTRRYDLFMAYGYTLLGVEIYRNMLMSPATDEYSDSEIAGVLSALGR